MSCRFVLRCLGFGLLLSILSGCASLFSSVEPVAPPRDVLGEFALEGRFSLLHDGKNYSGRLDWTHRNTGSELLLSSPFGQGLAEIVTDAGGARLTQSDGKTFVAPDVETLTQDVLGYPLPLGQMADWMRGQVRPGQGRLDSLGRVVLLEQDAWRIDYEYADQDPRSPPVRITAKRAGNFELRVIVQAWHRLSSKETSP